LQAIKKKIYPDTPVDPADVKMIRKAMGWGYGKKLMELTGMTFKGLNDIIKRLDTEHWVWEHVETLIKEETRRKADQQRARERLKEAIKTGRIPM
jgi:hypothetical protein